MAFSRWRVERCFEDQKCEIGLDQYEGRRYLGLKRHLILSCVSYLFLARVRQEWGGKNPELTVCQVHTAMAALVRSLGVVVTPVEGAGAGEGGEEDHLGAASQRAGSEEPREADPREAPRTRHQAHRAETVPMGHDLAL